MDILVKDPFMQRRLIAHRKKTGADRWDEVWDGIYNMSPLPNNLHQWLVSKLLFVLSMAVEPVEGTVLAQVNVSDRGKGWAKNYRQPDVAVMLPGGKAQDLVTHYRGGPDFVVEILSPHDRAREKLPFYAGIGVRELLLIDRDPWTLELYRLNDEELSLVGRVVAEVDPALASAVLSLNFAFTAGQDRPFIDIVHQVDGSRWRI
ncbi:Uma2 family endonuclease [Singulisphaera rosea]